MEPIQNISYINNHIRTKLNKNPEPQQQSVDSFKEVVTNAISKVDNIQKDAQVEVEKTVLGENQDIHRTILALHKADVSLKMAVEVRNKALEAYQEIMRMPV